MDDFKEYKNTKNDLISSVEKRVQTHYCIYSNTKKDKQFVDFIPLET